MQNVAWPATTVQSDGVMFRYSIAESRAIPVTMPGSAIGSTKSSEIAFLPKNRNRESAKAMQVPRRSASAAARRPTVSECTSASRANWSPHASRNQCVVKSDTGQVGILDAPNAFIAITRSGR